MTPRKLRERAKAMEKGLGVTFGDTPMALREAADEIDRLREALEDIAIGSGENILSQHAMRVRAYAALCN